MPEDRSVYAGRSAVLATMHGKEQAVAPAFMDAAGLTVMPAYNLDTDALGTFTGEIPRRGTMLEVAIAKARLGMQAAGLPLGIASEGSFGPHPAFTFAPGGIEVLVFVDSETGITIHETLIVDETNFAHVVAIPGDRLDAFLARVGFPKHGLIVRPNSGDFHPGLCKGIVDRRSLDHAVVAMAAISQDGRACIETDMRAHFNPTRMSSLAVVAKRLALRLTTNCASCAAPGWGRIDVARGLPCELCGTPTTLVAVEVFGCAACDYREERPRRDGQAYARPINCPECNP